MCENDFRFIAEAWFLKSNCGVFDNLIVFVKTERLSLSFHFHLPAPYLTRTQKRDNWRNLIRNENI